MGSCAKEIAKKLARACLGEYSIYYVYSRRLDEDALSETNRSASFTLARVTMADISASPDPLIQDQSDYAGSGSKAYACIDGGRIVGVCFYWFGQRYLQRNFWPLKEHEAKLVQIISLPEARGRGVATALIAWSAQDMGRSGFRRAYARIWHSNTPSLSAFRKAGWTAVAVVVEINPFRQRRAIRVRLNPRFIDWKEAR